MWFWIVALLISLVVFLLRRPLARWARYAYFMRFSILLWVFPLILVWANTTGARSLTSGIVTPSREPQYLCVAFFLASSSAVALILARIVVINGQERFGNDCPRLLEVLLADEHARYEWIAPLASQLNTAIVFWYFIANGSKEGVDVGQIGWGLAWGVLLAFVFWYNVNAMYYLTYRPAPGSRMAAHMGRAAARTLLFPRGLMLLGSAAGQHGWGDALEMADLRISLRWIRHLFQVPGYRWAPDGDLYEGHYLSILAAGGFFALYWVMWPLTAPVPVHFWAWFFMTLHFLGGLMLLAVVFSATPDPKRPQDRVPLRIWKALLTLGIVGFEAVIPYLYCNEDAERFPVLALVLILVISCVWALGGIAFFADRYRIPVLTLVVLAVAIPRYAKVYGGDEEHYLSTAASQSQPNLPTPLELLKAKLDADPYQPLIVVTSTGGGIHAAAWTTAILGKLETQFKNQKLGSFHEHVLLLSTVSGGSSGLYTYLRELDANTNDGKPNWDRMAVAARCSSLEAVGWGLVYYDIPKAFVPLAPYIWPLSNGVGDLNDSPIGKDRTWSLRTAFTRNLDDSYCRLDPESSSMIPRANFDLEASVAQGNARKLTLKQLDATAKGIPAFTMNTTTVENGERFLLSNYKLPESVPDLATDYRARSFLTTFTYGAPDLPLATAAQMSATFPVVSSAARVPVAVDASAASVHFVDGGYYDNDGTASAIEFLRYAVSPWTPQNCKAEKPAEKTAARGPSPAARPCVARILLIEIRNSGDVAPTPPESTPDHSGATSPWTLSDQAMAPLMAFYSAGHESVTARNRTALEILEQALAGKLEVERLVFADDNAFKKDQTDPLSWSLTPRQTREVADSAKALAANYAAAACWASHWDELWGKSAPEQAKVCGAQAASAMAGTGP